MPQYSPGDIVLILFPTSDITTNKKRPALIIIDSGDADIVVCRITGSSTRFLFDVEILDWVKAGLLKPSVARLDKIATLEKKLIDKILGKLEISDWNRILEKYTKLFESYK